MVCEKQTDYSDDYLQIDLGAEYSVCAVATQGKSSGSYLTSYKLSFSTDGETWSFYQEGGEDKVYRETILQNFLGRHLLGDVLWGRKEKQAPSCVRKGRVMQGLEARLCTRSIIGSFEWCSETACKRTTLDEH